MKDIIVALLIKDAVSFGASLLLGISIALFVLGVNKLVRMRMERHRRAMLELKRDLKRITR